MNTPRILDVVPLSAASNLPASAKPPTAGRPSVPEVQSGSAGGAGVPDAARRRVDEEKNRLDAAARATDGEQSRAKPLEIRSNFTNRVGYFDGSSMVFVDLVDERTQRELMRIFGPSQPPTEDAPLPGPASRAYEAAAGRRGRMGNPEG
jgi:hypothetical protein